jgi:hypothetical protein
MGATLNRKEMAEDRWMLLLSVPQADSSETDFNKNLEKLLHCITINNSGPFDRATLFCLYFLSCFRIRACLSFLWPWITFPTRMCRLLSQALLSRITYMKTAGRWEVSWQILEYNFPRLRTCYKEILIQLAAQLMTSVISLFESS